MTNRILPFLAFLIAISCGDANQTINPTEKPLIEAVYASGYVVARDQYQVFAQAEGFVHEKVVEDGDQVAKGSPLYILESDQQSSRYDLARKNFAVAQQNYRDASPVLKEIVAALSAARTRMRFDSVNFVRYQNLMDQNATSRGEFDRIRLAYDNSRSEYLLQQSRYEQIKNRLFLELESARSQLAIAGNEAGRYVIRSEVNGTVFQTLKEEGELIRRSEAVAVVGGRNAFYLQLAVDELDIRRLKKGQDVMVNIDAFPNQLFRATVEKVYPLVNRQQQSVRVDATLQDSIPIAVSGLAVEANIVINKKDKALVIPRAALVSRDSVIIQEDAGTRKIKIETGIQTLEEVEVTDGIGKDTRIMIKP